MAADVVVLVPVYKERLDAREQFSLDTSLAALAGRDVRFIAPASLDSHYYRHRYGALPVERFPAPCFTSIAEYNRLLLRPDFYARWLPAEFLLILQTDAIVLRDELDHWCAQPFDYVGAPWPRLFELELHTGRFEGGFAKHVRTHVGNGGLSLRRLRACMALLQEFGVERELFVRAGSSEDLFFSVLGAVSTGFVLPNEVTASLFAMEGRPGYYHTINGGRMPMGGHAWWHNEPSLWQQWLAQAGVVLPAGLV